MKLKLGIPSRRRSPPRRRPRPCARPPDGAVRRRPGQDEVALTLQVILFSLAAGGSTPTLLRRATVFERRRRAGRRVRPADARQPHGTRVPTPGRLSTLSAPPCSPTRPRTSDRPRPAPSKLDRRRCAPGRTGRRAATGCRRECRGRCRRQKYGRVAARRAAPTATRPPRSVNLIALDSRLSRIWRQARLSATSRRRPAAALDVDAARFSLEPHHVAAVGDQRLERERLWQNAEGAGGDLRGVEDQIDHRQQVVGRGVDDLGVLALLGRIAPA